MSATQTVEEPQYAGKLADPDFRTERARRAARSKATRDAIGNFVSRIPDLTPEQIETVRRALPPAPEQS